MKFINISCLFAGQGIPGFPLKCQCDRDPAHSYFSMKFDSYSSFADGSSQVGPKPNSLSPPIASLSA